MRISASDCVFRLASLHADRCNCQVQHHVLAIDIGSTRLKAAVLDPAGVIVSRCHVLSPLQAPAVQPADVLAAVAAVARNVCGGVPPGAIAITGATRTTVVAGHDGRAIGEAIALGDGRGADHAPALQKAYGASSAVGLGAFHPLARAMDLQRHASARYDAMRWMLDMKDWINLQLTGQVQVDNVALARIEPPDGDTEALLARLGLKAGLLGSVGMPAKVIGTIGSPAPQEWAWCAGVPVVSCGFDAWCASFGMGSVEAGAVYNVCGTTDVFGGFVRAPVHVPGIACLPWCEGLQHLGGPCLTGLSTLSWFGQQFLDNADPAAVIACAAAASDDCPLVLPFVHGERMPFWRSNLRASFLEVHNRHGRAEMARGLVDGLLMFQRWLIGHLMADAQVVHLGGGGSSLQGWPLAKASAFGVPVRIASCEEPALLGAAMCAQTALGRYASLPQCQQALRPAWRETAPDPALARRFQALAPRYFAHFDQLHAP